LAWWLVLAGLAAVAFWVAGEQWLRAELGRVEHEVQAGQIASARSRLGRLSALGLGGVEARYWRAACEEAEGQTDAALATWAAIPRGSKRFANASLRRARLALELGRFAEVEAALGPTEFSRTSQASAMRDSLLQQVDLFTGQFDSLRCRIEGEWGGPGNPAEILRKRYLVDNPRSFPVDALRSRLEEAGRLAPEDDRVWLGKAYLAIRTARFAEAEDWLKRCLRRRPEDPVVWRDDDRIDLFVANDMSANFLFLNRGGFRFQETAAEAGVATSTSGGYLAGMGVACGDLDGDGRLDLAVTNFYGESTTFYRNLGSGQFADQTAAIGLAAPSRYLLGFGAAFLDANNDGRLDLATANGHVNDLRPLVPFCHAGAAPAGRSVGAAGRCLEAGRRPVAAPPVGPRPGLR
jgi:tetratricopeptide (TPR) repeat protein